METYRITDNISATMTVRARNNTLVMEAVEEVARDLNAMLAFNPKRVARITVTCRGKGWHVTGFSRLPVEGPTETADFLKFVPLARPIGA